MSKLLLYFIFFTTLYAQESSVSISLYEDADHTLNRESAYVMRHLFKPYDNMKKSFGFTDSTIWVYVDLVNRSDTALSKVIALPYPHLDFVHVYTYQDQTLVDEYLTGDRVAFSNRKVVSEKFILPVVLQAGESKEMLIQIGTSGALNVGVNVFDLATFHADAYTSALIFGGYYGAVILMLVYNFILFLMIKERVYADYVVFHFFNLLQQLGLSGHAFAYLWPETPEYNNYFIPLAIVLTYYTAIRFTNSFLEVEKWSPRIYRYLNLLQYSQFILLIAIFTLPYSTSITIITVFGAFGSSSLFLTGLYRLVRTGDINAKFYIGAWSFLLLGAFLGELQNLGLLNMNLLTLHGPQIGAFMELALLSFALAYRYNTVFTKLVKTELDLRALNKDLEHKIAERTAVLDKKNHQLIREISNKNILMREVYHRVKNNLQIISGLLSLQSDRIDHPPSKLMFDESIQRIKAMAMVHEKLYQSENLELVNMQIYMQDLLQELQHSFTQEGLHFEVTCESIHLKLETAIPIGIIVNEIVTNALKYAFTTTQKKKVITLTMQNREDAFILEVYDNGQGADVNAFKNGFGFQLIDSLATYQLKGVIETYNDTGLHHKITFAKGLS